MPKSNSKKLTAFEEELMRILWQIGPSTVHQVMEALPEDRKRAYTSVSTILRILEGKKFIKATAKGRGHIYTPIYSLETHTKNTLKQLIQFSFANRPMELVTYLIEHEAISSDDIKQIEALISNKESS